MSDNDFQKRVAAIIDPTQLLEEIFTNAPVALQLYDHTGRSVLTNRAHTELFGAAPTPDYNIFEDHLVVERGLADLIRRAFAGERISTPTRWYDIRELRNVPPDIKARGRRIAISSDLMPLRDASGKVGYVLIVFNDHTDAQIASEETDAAARNAERARLAAEARAHQSTFLATGARLLSASLDLDVTLAQVARLTTGALADICIIDLIEPDGTYRRVAAVHANPAMQPLLDEHRGNYSPEPGSSHPAARVIATGQPELYVDVDRSTIEPHVKSPSHGETMSTIGVRSYLAFPLQVGERTLGAITLAYTGSDRYSEEDLPLVQALASQAAIAIENARLFRAIEQARREAEAAARAKDEFLAMLGHELRNPLAPIVTALELTRERDGASRERTIIERQVDHLRRLVDDLLDIAKITRGALDLDIHPVDIADAVTDAYELARPLIEQRNHEILIEVPRGLVVMGDRVRLAQIITNLLTNAARYTDPGGKIHVTADRGKGMVSIRVRDTGVGMTDELARTVFDTFTRGKRPIDRAAGGLGIGLAIVKALVHRHHGMVMGRSEGAGRGSEFEVVLPEHVGEPRKRPTTQMPPVMPATSSALIMVVDDNVDAGQLLADALEGQGYRTLAVGHPEEALAVARREHPTLALIDIGLPGMDGFELGRRLRIEHPRMILVALTGYGQQSDRDRSSAIGFAEHLVKPIKLATISTLLQRLLRNA